MGSVAGTEPELDHNYMSLVDNEPLLQDEVNYVKVGGGGNDTGFLIFVWSLSDRFEGFRALS